MSPAATDPPASSEARALAGSGLGWMTAWAHLAVLWALAFAQPLFDVLAESPEFFVARGNTRADILIFASVLVLVPPTILIGIERVLPAGLIRTSVHAAFVGLLAAAIILQFLDGTGGPGAVLISAAGVLGALLAYVYARVAAVRGALTVLSPVPLLVLGLFLLVSPVSELVLSPGAEARAGSGDARRTPVVFVIFDELSTASLMDRRGAIDDSLYPNFAALARASTWYRNATTVADVTSAAVPALVSGERPAPDALPVASRYPRNVFTLLGGTHRLEVEEPVTDICPEKLCGEEDRPPASRRLRALADDLSVVSLHLLLPDDLEDNLPAVDRTFAGFRAGGRDAPAQASGAEEDYSNRNDEVARFLGRIDDDDPPATLYFLHVGLPHVPWQYLPSGRQYLVNGPDLPSLESERWGDDRWLVEQALQRHLLQVGYTDRVLGRIVRRLRSEQRWDDALVVVTADHGASFQPGRDRRSVSRPTFADIAGIPLFVKLPGQRHGRVDDRAALTVDVVPTIAEELGLTSPRGADGRSLERAGRDSGRVTVFRRAGGDVTMPFPAFLRMRDAAVRHRVALFGEGEGEARLFDIGPDRDLVGRRVGELPAGPAGALRAEIDGAEFLAQVGSAPRPTPAFITGRLLGPTADRSRLLVAVNGRVRSSTYSFRSSDRVLFASMVPEQSLNPGANSVELFEVEGRGADRSVKRIGVTATAGYRLLERGGSEAVVPLRGREARVRPGAVPGFAEQIVLDGGTVTVKGWSATRAGPAERVVVFVGGRLVASGRPSGPRPDVAKNYGPRALDSEYRASGSVPPGTRPGDVRVFGIRGRRASELSVLPP